MSDARAGFAAWAGAVRGALQRGRTGLAELLRGRPAPDLADLLEELDDRELRVAVLGELPIELASEALTEMDESEERAALLAALTPSVGAELLHELQDDDAVDLISELEPAERDLILAELPAGEADELQDLLRYGEDTAGGIMTRAVVRLRGSATADEAIAEVRRQGREVEDFYSVFVVDELGRLVGTVPLDDLILADPDAFVATLAEPAISVRTDTDQEEVGRLLSRYNLVSMAVINDQGHLLGRITFDDVIDVLEAEQTEDIFRLVGVRDDEGLRDSWLESVRTRLPWLFLNLLTATGAASVIWIYEDMIAQFTALAVLAPIIAALGGNAGTQSLAVTIRRLTLSGSELGGRPWAAVGKEILVGLVNGAALGLLAAGIGYLVAGVPEMGLVVLLALWGNLIVAGFAGAFVPTLLSRLRIDPAVASAVFVHTMTDLIGFFLLLGIASRILL